MNLSGQMCQGNLPVCPTRSSHFSSAQSLSHVRLFASSWTAAHQDSLSITNSWSLLKLMSIELVMHPTNPSSVIPSPPTFHLCQDQGLFSESVLCIRWSEYWSFSCSISPFNEYSGLISFRMDQLDLLKSKGLSRVFSNTTVQKHQFFSAQLSL